MKKQTWTQWTRLVERDPNTPSLLRKGSLAALTGTDVRVLDAFVACLVLYANGDRRRSLDAMRVLLPIMQDSTRWIAKELIPFVLEWHDRDRLWAIVCPRLEAVR